ncbi:MAG TPA: nuclear transport factor 2 family protein [Steroidobacteraceae bacterium]|nr:nuclear transport factor 2 family protein [Steroidobacteraceae bacterium]
MRSALEVVNAFYAAATKGSIDDMAQQLAPDVRWTEMAGTPYGGTYVGPEAVFSGVFGPLGEEWENFSFTPERFHDAGTSVAVAGWYTAVFRKTGKPLRCRSLHVWDVREGKVVAFEQFCDSLVMSRSMT